MDFFFTKNWRTLVRCTKFVDFGGVLQWLLFSRSDPNLARWLTDGFTYFQICYNFQGTNRRITMHKTLFVWPVGAVSGSQFSSENSRIIVTHYNTAKNSMKPVLLEIGIFYPTLAAQFSLRLKEYFCMELHLKLLLMGRIGNVRFTEHTLGPFRTVWKYFCFDFTPNSTGQSKIFRRTRRFLRLNTWHKWAISGVAGSKLIRSFTHTHARKHTSTLARASNLRARADIEFLFSCTTAIKKRTWRNFSGCTGHIWARNSRVAFHVGEQLGWREGCPLI